MRASVCMCPKRAARKRKARTESRDHSHEKDHPRQGANGLGEGEGGGVNDEVRLKGVAEVDEARARSPNELFLRPGRCPNSGGGPGRDEVSCHEVTLPLPATSHLGPPTSLPATTPGRGGGGGGKRGACSSWQSCLSQGNDRLSLSAASCRGDRGRSRSEGSRWE